MLTLGQIRGQDRVVERLRRAMTSERVPHAYLFAGPAGVGKHTTAVALAAAMNCERAPGEGCGECATCERIGAGLHPDVVTLERQGASQTVPIEVIRTRVIPALGMAPHEARARFFLIEEATSLLGPAANALLKTLEEPPARTHFVLATASVGELLPTIRSRCQRVSFQPLPAALRAEIEGDAEGAGEMEQAVERLIDRVAGGAGAGGGASVDPMALARAVDGLAGRKEKPAQVARAIRLLAQRLGQEARRSAQAGDLATASVRAAQARRALACEMSLSVHNAHALLAVDHLARDLAAMATGAR